MEENDIENSFAKIHPELVSEWDVEKNDGLLPDQVSYASGRKVWWKCEKNHSWKAPIYSRHAGTGCPYCAGHKHGKILCIETGKLYSRYNDVANDLGISIASVSLVLNGKQESVKGYHLCYMNNEEK